MANREFGLPLAEPRVHWTFAVAYGVGDEFPFAGGHEGSDDLLMWRGGDRIRWSFFRGRAARPEANLT